MLANIVVYFQKYTLAVVAAGHGGSADAFKLLLHVAGKATLTVSANNLWGIIVVFLGVFLECER